MLRLNKIVFLGRFKMLKSFFSKNLWIYIEKLEPGAIYNVKKFYDRLKNGSFCKMVILVIFCQKFNMLKYGIFCKMVILVVLKVF